MFTAIIAIYGDWFISGATIEQSGSIGCLMPIVASMGGNAGMQTLAVTVRSIATNELTKNNFSQNIIKDQFFWHIKWNYFRINKRYCSSFLV